jgi:type IV pilus assembly protein PilW
MMHNMNTVSIPGRRDGGFTLVELMVAMALGLILTLAMSSVYLFGKSAFSRQEQLSSLQQGVRTAFEYLASDARMVGHLGCYTGKATPPAGLATGTIATNYAVGIEGYEYKTAGAALTLSSSNPANMTTAGNFEVNTAAAGVLTIPLTTVSSDGLTPGSDVLVIRTVVGKPQRLTADLAASATAMSLQVVSGGTCSDGSTGKVSGFCNGSHGLVASCTNARTFSVTAAASSGSLTTSNLGPDAFVAGTSEVFPMQTIAYYIKRSESGTTTSLYRRIFNGDPAGGVEQELIEGVESMQLRYGVDTTLPDADGVIDGNYQTAEAVANWSRVVAVRLSLLMRATDPVPNDVAVPASGLVNDVAVTYPTAASGARQFDRRVFTTTVAVRNKISYL